MTVSSALERDVAPAVQTVETGASWLAATIVLFIFTFSYGAPLVVVVALKEIAADFDNARSTPALAYSLAWLGSGTGALAFGWIAERFGIRPTVFFGAAMLGAGLAPFPPSSSSWPDNGPSTPRRSGDLVVFFSLATLRACRFFLVPPAGLMGGQTMRSRQRLPRSHRWRSLSARPGSGRPSCCASWPASAFRVLTSSA